MKKAFTLISDISDRVIAVIALCIFLSISINAQAGSARVDDAVQYMASCTEAKEHGGSNYALTSWLDSWDAANKAGKDHELRMKGHRWTILQRTKPKAESGQLRLLLQNRNFGLNTRFAQFSIVSMLEILSISANQNTSIY